MTVVAPKGQPAKHTNRGLRRPRVTGLKAKVPRSVKNGPKALQGQLLSGAARRLRRNVDAESAVLISSWPRSGSTWLFEMLASDPSLLPVFEPFHPTHNPAFAPFANELGFIVPPGEAGAANLSALVREVASGRRLTRWSANRARRERLWKAPRTLVKEVRLGPALPWLTEDLSVPTIVLLRHPCAVIESALRSPGEWQRWPTDDMRRVLSTSAPADAVSALGRAERPELLAALWAAEAVSSLALTREHKSVEVVTYEELVRTPGSVLARLGERTGLADISADPERLSLLTDQSSHLHHGERDPLAGWKANLAEVDARHILETVRHFGIDFYTENLEPDFKRLRAVIR